MKWRGEYACGIQRIDEQHKMLFGMSDDFRACLDEGRGGRVYPSLLTNLESYCAGHFAFEEDCMNKYRCPVARINKEAHMGFLDVLAKFRQRHTDRGYDHTDARALIDAMDEWLDSHICAIDIHLKHCVKD